MNAFSATVIVGLALQFIILAPASATENYRAAIPDGKLGAVVTLDDYPQDSIRLGEQGLSTVRYEINETGRVTPGSCVVQMTSGFPRLDFRTCELAARFRFEPALRNGKPTSERREQSLSWVLPGSENRRVGRDISIRQARSWAQCAVRERPDAAVPIILAEFGSEQQERALKRALRSGSVGCWDVETFAKFPLWLFAGEAAEQLIETKRGALSNADIADAIAGAMVLPKRQGIDAFSYCVIRRRPVDVLDFVGIYPGSLTEIAMLQKMHLSFAACLPAGQTLPVTEPAIRSLLMAALYGEMVRLDLGVK